VTSHAFTVSNGAALDAAITANSSYNFMTPNGVRVLVYDAATGGSLVPNVTASYSSGVITLSSTNGSDLAGSGSTSYYVAFVANAQGGNESAAGRTALTVSNPKTQALALADSSASTFTKKTTNDDTATFTLAAGDYTGMTLSVNALMSYGGMTFPMAATWLDATISGTTLTIHVNNGGALQAMGYQVIATKPGFIASDPLAITIADPAS
jgi:hypothetical protein